MDNPWFDYFNRSSNSKYHPQDEKHIIAFNSAISLHKSSDKYVLRKDLEPLPYLGNPTAPILVLLANPGAGGSGPEKNIAFTGKKLDLYRKNLLHQQESPSDFIDKFDSPDDNQLESPYFKKHTRRLIEITSAESVATKIFFVNFHGYQSKAWYLPPFTFPTQHYSFNLVSEAIRRDALVIMSRNMLGWFTAVPGLFDHKNRVKFVSTRSIYLTEGNLVKSAFKKLLERL